MRRMLRDWIRVGVLQKDMDEEDAEWMDQRGCAANPRRGVTQMLLSGGCHASHNHGRQRDRR